MRLSVFMLEHLEELLQAWEDFARSLLPGRSMTVAALRDHAEKMVRFIAADIETEQSRSQTFAKSLGRGEDSSAAPTGAQEHGLTRAVERFTLDEMASEYRALRASVTRMWLDHPGINIEDARQLVRFNEAIDQVLAESIAQFVAKQTYDSELFTAAIGHDLRNPLNAVAMGAQLLGTSDALSGNDHQILEQMQAALSRQGKLLDDLGDFSRVRLGGFAQIHRVDCDLQVLCRNLANELRLTKLDIEVTASGDTRASVDPLRIEQLVSNLVANAVQHGSADGKVTIRVVGTMDHVKVAVHNQGEPIPQDRLETIFHPFVYGPDGHGDHRGRLGLGLFIAHEIAVVHGGSMAVESDGDAGTTFIANLPRANLTKSD